MSCRVSARLRLVPQLFTFAHGVSFLRRIQAEPRSTSCTGRSPALRGGGVDQTTVDQFDDAFADALQWLLHGADVGQGAETGAQAVESGDGHVLRDAQAGRLQGVDDVYRDQIVRGDDGRGMRRQGQQLTGGRDAAVGLEARFDDELIVPRDFCRGQRVEIALQARLVGAGQFGARHEGDASMPGAQQWSMICRVPVVVVGHDAGDAFIRDVTAHDDEGEIVFQQGLDGVAVVVGGEEDDAINFTGAADLQQLAGSLSVSV